MTLSQFKEQLSKVSELNFVQVNGHQVPKHFHITEAGLTTKSFIDCGGTVRTEKTANLQIWVANDTEHRLSPNKLKDIIEISERLFAEQDLELEVEYQTETIGRYGLDFNGSDFVFRAKETNCLAKDHCGIPSDKLKPKIKLSELQNAGNCCAPGTSCC